MNLGIDLGTSEVKVVLCDQNGEVLASASRPLLVSSPQPLWSEQNPLDWWQATDEAVLALHAQVPTFMSGVKSIGLTGQMHGAIVMDGAGEVLRPAILWNDGRSAAQCLALEKAVPQSRTITGNIAMAGFTAPKLLWLRENEPSVFQRIRKVLLPKDWLRWRLCGQFFSDMSDASGTLWLDVGRRAWSDLMLAACDLDSSHMPALREGVEPAGELSAAIAKRWGLARTVIIAAGGGDNAASAVGMGATQAGQGFLSLGTSGVVFVVTDKFCSQPQDAVHSFCHAVPRCWHQMSVMLSCGASLSWLARVLDRDMSTLVAMADALPSVAKAAAPIFLPYLSGERTPHNNPQASGVLFGLHGTHGDADLAYAVMEGVAFSMADGVRVLREAGTSIGELHLVGGGSRSDGWSQLVASSTGVDLVREEGAEIGAAIGAAHLAHAAFCGALPVRTSKPSRRFAADSPDSGLLEPRLERFRRLYPAIAPEFARAWV
jgi:xylulokinase